MRSADMANLKEQISLRPKILIAVDTALISVIRSVAVMDHYELVNVDNVELILNNCLYERPDAILLDSGLLELGILDMAKRLRKEATVSEIPILIITSDNDDALIERISCADGVYFISKPFRLAAIRQAIKQLLDVKRSHEELSSERSRFNSEKLNLEDKLRQANKMEAIGRVAGGIAHDFNNILTAILGYVELAQAVIKKGDQEKLNRYLAEIAKASDRARSLIHQMLNYTRKGNTKQELVNVKALIEEVSTLLKSILPSSVTLEIELSNPEMNLLVEPVRMHQIVMNLCVNARDAMEGKGNICIVASESSVENSICSSCSKCFSGRYINISISDSGKGINKNELSKIFEPFYTTKEAGRGTGMGLSVVNEIVHQYEGHIQVRTSDSGTRFDLYFPVAPPSMTAI